MGLPRHWALPLWWELCLGAEHATQETGKQGGRYGLPGLWKKSEQKLPSTTGVTLLGFKSVRNLACPSEFCLSHSPAWGGQISFLSLAGLEVLSQLASALHWCGGSGISGASLCNSVCLMKLKNQSDFIYF